MKKLLTILFTLCLMVNIFAGDAFIIPLNSSLYDVIDTLYLLEGKALPESSRPWSKAQAEKNLKYIGKTLSEENIDLYNSALAILEKEDARWHFDDGTSLGVSMDVFPEMYIHSNTEEFVSEEHWAYNFDDRNLFANLKMEFGIDDFFYTYCDLSYNVDRYGNSTPEFYTDQELESGVGVLIPGIGVESITGSNDDYQVMNIVKSADLYKDKINFNIPKHSVYMDYQTPKRAFITFAGDKWSFMFGRDKLNWGNSNVGNFVVDSHIDFHEMTRVQVFSDYFTYEWTNLFLDTNRTVYENDRYYHIFMLHRLDFRPFEKVTFGISENLMYKSQILNFGNFNPGFIYHNLSFRDIFNAIAVAELNITPIKGLNIYGQFALDQAKAPNEAVGQSDANAIMAGVEYAHRLGNGYLTENVEFIQTSPLLYRRDKVDFLASHHTDNHGATKVYYIGFPYGGDSRVLNFSVSYNIPEVFKTKLNLELLEKGKMNVLHPHNDAGNNNEYANLVDNKTPSGNIINQYLTLTLSAEYFVPKFVDFIDASIETNLAYVAARKYNKTTKEYTEQKDDIQFALALKITF